MFSEHRRKVLFPPYFKRKDLLILYTQHFPSPVYSLKPAGKKIYVFTTKKNYQQLLKAYRFKSQLSKTDPGLLRLLHSPLRG